MQNSAFGKFLPRLTFQIPREAGMIMKLLTVFILAACIQVHARVTAQTVTYSAKNIPIEDAFKEIKRQTKIGFMYNTSILKVAKPVTIEAHNTQVKEVLDACFKDQPFTYELSGTTVVVKERTASSKETVAEFLPAPPMDVHGRVTDSAGNPLAGASVKVKGISSKGVVTDDNGEFLIKQVDNNSILVIDFVGYGSREYSIAGRSEIVAILRVTNKELAEVAIQSYSSGYQRLSRNHTPGSIVYVSNEVINRRISPDIASRLEGVASGILFTKNVPGGSADISIRGRSTLFANAKPLIVIDNFPYDGDINNINPNDIENITILKDASAASIWGVQSGNGVIVLTTKKGKRNMPLAVDVNTNLTVTEKPNVFYSRQFMNSSDFIFVEKFLFDQGYYDASLTDPRHPVVSPVVQLLSDQRAGLVTADVVNAKINGYKQNDVRNDISKFFYQKATQQQYAVNLSGGSDRAEYYLSIGYDKDLGDMTRNQTSRFTLNSNNNFYLLKNLLFSANYVYTQVSTASNSTLNQYYTGGSYNAIYPYAQFVDANGNPTAVVKTYNSAWLNDPSSQAGRLNWMYYPLKELSMADNTSTVTDNRLSLGTRYSFLHDFALNLKYTYQKSYTKGANYYQDSTFYARDLYNSYYNPGASVSQPVAPGGILQQNMVDQVSHRARVQLDYAHKFSGDQRLSGIIGGEITQIKGNNFIPATLYGYNKEIGNSANTDFYNYYPQYPSGNFSTLPGSPSTVVNTNRFISYFGNATYTYKEKYTLSASGRIDKSNLFGVSANQKSVPLYSFGIAYEISKESFYHVGWLPYLNLRTTYGYNGNLNSALTAMPTILYGTNGYFSQVPVALLNSNGNPQLRWERIRMTNFAVDFATKKGLFSGSIEYYLKKGLDMFGTTLLAPSTGNPSFLGNTANINGHGLDITLNIQPINTNDFKWKSVVLLSNEINNVSKYMAKTLPDALLRADASGGNISPFEGKPIFGIYSYRSGPLTHDTGDPQGYINGKLSTDYSAIIAANTLDSLVYHGSARPTIYGSWRNDFTFKRFSLSVNITYKIGYYFKRNSIGYQYLFSAWGVDKDFAYRWQKPGDEATTFVPSMPASLAQINSNRDYFYSNSDKLVEKGDHVRLRDISIGYDLTSVGITKVGIKRLRVYGYISNLGILWRANKDGIDPDVYSGGLPSPRTYAIGIQANF